MQNLKIMYYSLFISFAFVLTLFAQPNISVSPQSFDVTLNSAKITQQKLTIANNGTEKLNFLITGLLSNGSTCNDYILQFDAINDYVSIPFLSPIINNPIDQFTFEGWIYIDSYTGDTQQFMEGMTANGEIYLETDGNSNSMMFQVATDNGFGHEIWTSPLSLKTWHHLAAIYDGHTQQIYLDGNLEESDTWSDTFTLTTGITLGKDYELEIQHLNGRIDEVRLWNRALTPDEISFNMHSHLSGSEDGLVGYWPFNEGSGDYAFDLSINKNDGILQGKPQWVSLAKTSYAEWLNIDIECDTISANSELCILFTFNASGLIGGVYTEEIFIHSNDPNQSVIKIPLNLHVSDAPSLSTNSDTLDFSKVFLEDSCVMELVITNTGSQDLLIPNIEIAPSQYSVKPEFASIDPQETETIVVEFRPKSEGLYPGILTFNSNDPDQPAYDVMLLGEGIRPPEIAVSPESLNISMQVGETITNTITIMNNGYSDLKFEIKPGSQSDNYALLFDGIDDYVDVGSVMGEMRDFTISAWIKTEQIAISGMRHDDPAIIGTRQRGGLTDDFVLTNYNGNLAWYDEFCRDHCSGDPHNDYDTGQFIADGKWHQVAVVRDNTALHFYIDGEESGSYSTESYTVSDNNIEIGRALWGESMTFQGTIDEVRIWNIVRTKAEIQADMNLELNGNEEGLIGYWNFNEGSGDYAYDKSQNNHNGILQAGPEWVKSDAPIIKWISCDPSSGICSPASSHEIKINIETSNIDTGIYQHNILIESNDPIRSHVKIPLNIHIITTGLEEEGLVQQPKEFVLSQNYPNPFNPTTMIKYQLPITSNVRISIHNLLGQKVVTLLDERQQAGNHQVEWDASGFASGIYYYRIEADEFRDVKKMVLLR